VTKTCPCCGQPIPPALTLPPILQRIYDFVQRWPGCTRSQIADHVYADDPNGGPDSLQVISQHVWRLNVLLKPHGLMVRSHGGPDSTYRIERADGYDADDDMTKSIEASYEAIRARVAKGGSGWTPPEVTP
jgi:hypothetical protein